MILVFIFILLFFCPSAYADLSTFTSHSLGSYYGLGIKSDGTLWAWGRNNYANIGDGTYEAGRLPNKIHTATNWSKIMATSEHSKAINSSGELYTWGKNQYGQLGDGTTTNVYVPTKVGEVTTWSKLGHGVTHGGVIRTDGSLWLFGNNDKGQMGFTADDTCYDDALNEVACQKSPKQLTGTWSEISGGSSFSIGIKSDGTMWGWGWNNTGQVGDGTTTDRSAPVAIIPAVSTWSKVSSGYRHSLALRSDGSLWAWGYNGWGQLGQNDRTTRTSPVQITGTWIAISAGYEHSLGIKSDGSLWSWGGNFDGTYAAVAGQLGTGTASLYVTSPVQIGSATDWVDVSAGAYISSARKSDGTVYVWGNNNYYELGNASTTDSTTPVALTGYALYVSTTGGTTKAGTFVDPYSPSTIPWASFESGVGNPNILFWGGTYSDTLTVRHNYSGNRVYIRPCSYSGHTGTCDDKVIFSRAYNNIVMGSGTNYAQYVTVDGETTSGSQTRNINVKPTMLSTATCGICATNDNSNISIKWVEITDTRNTSSSPALHASGTGYSIHMDGGTNVEIAYCYFYDNWAHSDIYMRTDDTTPGFSLGSIHHNSMYKGTSNYIYGNANLDIYSNTFDATEAPNPYDIIHLFVDGECFAGTGYGEKGIHYVRIFGNDFDQSDQSIFLENRTDTYDGGTKTVPKSYPTEKVLIFDNLFKCSVPIPSETYYGKTVSFKTDHPVAGETCTAGGGTVTTSTQAIVKDVIIANNTWVNNLYGINFGAATTGSYTISTFTVKNNIFYEVSTSSGYVTSPFINVGSTSVVASWGSGSDITISKNLIYDNDTIKNYHRPVGGNWTLYTGLNDWNSILSSEGSGGENYQGDPNFGTGYILQASSTNAIGRGDNLSSAIVALFGYEPSGGSWTTDKAGNTRLGNWDIGAYEYLGSGGFSLTIGSSGTKSIAPASTGTKTLTIQ